MLSRLWRCMYVSLWAHQWNHIPTIPGQVRVYRFVSSLVRWHDYSLSPASLTPLSTTYQFTRRNDGKLFSTEKPLMWSTYVGSRCLALHGALPIAYCEPAVSLYPSRSAFVPIMYLLTARANTQRRSSVQNYITSLWLWENNPLCHPMSGINVHLFNGKTPLSPQHFSKELHI